MGKRKVTKPQTPKVRNFHAYSVLAPDSPFRSKRIPDKLAPKLYRKRKHKGNQDEY